MIVFTGIRNKNLYPTLQHLILQ